MEILQESEDRLVLRSPDTTPLLRLLFYLLGGVGAVLFLIATLQTGVWDLPAAAGHEAILIRMFLCFCAFFVVLLGTALVTFTQDVTVLDRWAGVLRFERSAKYFNRRFARREVPLSRIEDIVAEAQGEGDYHIYAILQDGASLYLAGGNYAIRHEEAEKIAMRLRAFLRRPLPNGYPLPA